MHITSSGNSSNNMMQTVSHQMMMAAMERFLSTSRSSWRISRCTDVRLTSITPSAKQYTQISHKTRSMNNNPQLTFLCHRACCWHQQRSLAKHAVGKIMANRTNNEANTASRRVYQFVRARSSGEKTRYHGYVGYDNHFEHEPSHMYLPVPYGTVRYCTGTVYRM